MIIYGVSKAGRIYRNEQPVYVPTIMKPMNSKVCSKCGCTKDIGMFAKDCKAKDGYRSSCKACDRAAYLERREQKEQGKK